MADLRGFNAQEVEPNLNFEAIPAGDYVAIITESEMKATKNANGSYLQFTFQIIEGPYQGRLMWTRLNLDNPNRQAVGIARSELSAICRAVGVMTPDDSVQLHNLPLIVRVRCKKRKDIDEITNVIKGYDRKESVKKQSGATADNTPPWMRVKQ